MGYSVAYHASDIYTVKYYETRHSNVTVMNEITFKCYHTPQIRNGMDILWKGFVSCITDN